MARLALSCHQRAAAVAPSASNLSNCSGERGHLRVTCPPLLGKPLSPGPKTEGKSLTRTCLETAEMGGWYVWLSWRRCLLPAVGSAVGVDPVQPNSLLKQHSRNLRSEQNFLKELK